MRARPWKLAVGLAVLAAVAGTAWLFRVSLDVDATANAPLPDLPFEFLHQPLEHPALDALRSRERLDDVVVPGRSRLEKLVLLRHWTRMQWEPGDPDPYPPWDALVVLDWIRQGKTGGFCGQYAQVFAQACLSFGWRPRYLEIGPADNPVAHFTTEVWVDTIGKWVLLDAWDDIQFEKGGTPLSGLEVHELLVAGRAGEISALRGPERTPLGADEAKTWIDRFHYLRFHRKMDHLSNPLDARIREDLFEWRDSRTIPWEESDLAPSDPEVPHVPPAKNALSDRELFDFPLNRVRVEVHPDRFRGVARLALSHDVPDFDHYALRREGGEWERVDGDEIEVEVGDGGTTIEVAGVNKRGAEGVPARLVLRWRGW